MNDTHWRARAMDIGRQRQRDTTPDLVDIFDGLDPDACLDPQQAVQCDQCGCVTSASIYTSAYDVQCDDCGRRALAR